MVIKPTADNIIVRVIQEDTSKTASGILLPKTNVKSDMAEVISIGEGRTLNNGTILKSSLNVGDLIIFNKFAGTEIKANDETYLIIKETDILAVILKE